MPKPKLQEDKASDKSIPFKIPNSTLNDKDDDNISMLSDDQNDNVSISSKRRSSSSASTKVNKPTTLKEQPQGPGWWGRTVQAIRNRGQNDDDNVSVNSRASTQRRLSRGGSSVSIVAEAGMVKETRFQEAERHAFSRWMKSIFEREGIKRKKELATLARVEGPIFWYKELSTGVLIHKLLETLWEKV